MKKILIALDYNPVSEVVAEAGYAIAQQLGAKVCLMHVVADASYYEISYPEFMGFSEPQFNPNNATQRNDMQQIGNDFLESAKKHLQDDSVETHLGEGKTSKAILDFSDSWGADLLVLGTHSHSTLEKIFLGTVASRVIEKTKIPVHLVPVKR